MKSIAVISGTQQESTLLSDLLHWHGFTTFQLHNDRRLLPLLGLMSPELVIVEMQANQARLCDRIRHSPVLGHLPIIACAPARPAYADAHICAPYSAEAIFQAVQALQRPRSFPSLRSSEVG